MSKRCASLAVLVFVAAFVPLVGLLVAGALAILGALATKGWVDAVILLGILIIEDQLEAHLLQPKVVVGRAIRLHPLAVILALAVGGVLAGIAGAVVAVPIVAVITGRCPNCGAVRAAAGWPIYALHAGRGWPGRREPGCGRGRQVV